MELLPHTSATRCLLLFTTSAKYADLRPSHYYAAQQWLIEHNLFMTSTRHDGAPGGESIFKAAVSEATWFPDADQVVTSPIELPLDAVEAARACNLTEHNAFAILRRVHSSVDLAQRKRVGDAGELRLIELLQSCTACRIEHVAAVSDGYGFDVLVGGSSIELHLEVKSTTRKNRNVIFLSRHEFETMLHDPFWRLVFLRLNADLQVTEVFTVKTEWVRSAAPKDLTPGIEWQSVRVDLPVEQLERGIKDLASVLQSHRTAETFLLRSV